MATLIELYGKFSNPTLKVGYTDALYSRGLGELLSRLQFSSFVGKSKDFNVSSARPTGTSARDPMSTTKPPSGKGETHRVNLFMGMLGRDFDVSDYAQSVLTDHQDQRAIDARQAAEQMFEEFALNVFHGDGSYQEVQLGQTSTLGDNLCGFDWWLDQYSGKYKSGSFTSSTNDQVRYYNAKYRDLKQFAADASEPQYDTTKKEVFSYDHVDAGLLEIKGRKDDIYIVSDKLSYKRFLKTLRAAGGNTEKMLVGETMAGKDVFTPGWDGIPWFLSDTAGAAKISDHGDSTGGGKIQAGTLDLLEVDGEANESFIGFSDLDIGRKVRVDGADFSAASGHATAVDPVTGAALADDETIIKEYVSNRSVNLVHAAGGAVADKIVEVAPTQVTYIVRNNPMEPVGACYSALAEADETTFNTQIPNEYYGTIAGWEVKGIGAVQEGGFFHRYRGGFIGNVVNENPFNLVRISHYKVK